MVNRNKTAPVSKPPTTVAKQTLKPAAPPQPRPATTGESRIDVVRRIYRETVAELRKVQWPDRTTTRNLTLVVIGMSFTLALVLGGVDAGLTRLVEFLVTR